MAKPGLSATTTGAKKREGWGETLLTLLYAILIAVFIRTFYSSRSTFRPAR